MIVIMIMINVSRSLIIMIIHMISYDLVSPHRPPVFCSLQAELDEILTVLQTDQRSWVFDGRKVPC